ncbi:MAG: carbohydrate kinase [Flavipsychrobacter sp.]|nr:carbohydrate kinase [Flavipsychrobacter sp.]
MQNQPQHNIVCFGEILWDVLPEQELPGGAPMNVTYHLNKLGKKATLISSIGDDDRGTALIKVFNEKGIDTSYVQTDPEHRTSLVLATPNEAGDMKYNIVEDVAWDYINRLPIHDDLISNARYFVYGSLATRNKYSRETLFSLLETSTRKVFDINLRAPFINRDLLEYQLNRTQVLKMNEDELDLVAGWYSSLSAIEDKINLLQQKFGIETVIVTRGARGALVNYQQQFYAHDGFRVTVADTIGSGDSFLAAFLTSFLNGNPLPDVLNFACTVGAFVATKEGGCPDYELADIKTFLT